MSRVDGSVRGGLRETLRPYGVGRSARVRRRTSTPNERIKGRTERDVQFSYSRSRHMLLALFTMKLQPERLREKDATGWLVAVFPLVRPFR
ncbi:hypothetical protein EVAR_68894_1 [Eumeta japonica]|uniref:Uncharacterized protein n=1 Tax=Eumeta variegata TaxID=151549 RepID=A0A4C1ZSE6_EUMVA|nr:hypothetical protein EVAR_68894_1 [Eumeta japonica]